MTKRKRLIFISIAILALIIIYNSLLSGITPSTIRAWVDSFGSLAPLAYISTWIVLPIFFFPVPVLALSGGLSFGLVDGTIYTLIGAMINSSVMYYLAKVLAKDMIRKYLVDKMPKRWWDRFMKANKTDSFFIVFICRLIPAMPYNVINYISGLANIKFTQYTFATFLGILPGTIIFLNVGDKILDANSQEFIYSIVFVLLLTIFSFYLGKMLNKKNGVIT